MYNVDLLVDAINKIGPKYKNLLNKLDIYTVKDILYHFPFRYDDFSIVKNINELKDQDIVTVKGKVQNFINLNSKSNKRLSKAVILDSTGKLDLIWFNQQYLQKLIKKDQTYCFSGKIQKFANKLTMVSASFEEENEKNLNTKRLVPIYPETAGVSSKYLRSKIEEVIGNIKKIPEFIPQEILEQENFNEINWSIKQIHFPDDKKNLIVAKNRFIFEELFMEMIKVQSRKALWNTTAKAIKLKSFEKEINEFIKSLPFNLTNEQLLAVKKIIDDVSVEKPMNRLLEGDVGTGKTIVAVIASYLTFLNNKKTIYMAPTEILAKQHYNTFNKLLPNLNIKILTGSKKDKNIFEADIIIGTHAILFSNEQLQNVGLVIIDEQHRFGVIQRGKLLQLGTDEFVPHFLSMTATPIPRTLALTLYGDLDISLLKVHPNKDRKVTTKVITQSKKQDLYNWIKQKNEQTFIVCPLIEESESTSFENVKSAEKEFKELSEGVFKDVKVALLHGKMKPSLKMEIIEKFRNKEIMILVSTPVIEVGIDVPDASIIVIESAERYGLASLHQLRGRVGRGQKEGFCFVSMSNNSKGSYARLKKLETVTNGLDLAEIDMKNRGSGDIYGTMQHGYKKFKIASIYDTELLEKAKIWAENIFEKINNYPQLNSEINNKYSNLVKNN